MKLVEGDAVVLVCDRLRLLEHGSGEVHCNHLSVATCSSDIGHHARAGGRQATRAGGTQALHVPSIRTTHPTPSALPPPRPTHRRNVAGSTSNQRRIR